MNTNELGQEFQNTCEALRKSIGNLNTAYGPIDIDAVNSLPGMVRTLDTQLDDVKYFVEMRRNQLNKAEDLIIELHGLILNGGQEAYAEMINEIYSA